MKELIFLFSIIFLSACDDSASTCLSQDAPIFTSNLNVSVEENQLSATTLVATSQNSIEYFLTGSDEVHFNLDKDNGVLVFKQMPDFETKTKYVLQALAINSKQETTREDLVINILDVNEVIPPGYDPQLPKFTSSSTATVKENQLNAIVLTATNSPRYSIHTQDASSFNVDQLSGIVTFIAYPDYDIKQNYSFIARASNTDGSTEQEVSIIVLETNTELITHNNTSYLPVKSNKTQRIWLDRNLGASKVCDLYYEAACLGDLYQWGRDYDGHQIKTSDTSREEPTDIRDTHSKFIIASYEKEYDWANAADIDGTLRQSNWKKTDGSSICPDGYRVPTISEFNREIRWDRNATAMFLDNDLKLPRAGIREGERDGTYLFNGYANYWSTDIYSTHTSKSYYFGVNSYGILSEESRSHAMSIRCISR